MMRELAETGMRASPGDLGRNQAQLFYLARFADRAAFLSLGNIISATSSTLVFLRYSNCFDCCATHRHLGGARALFGAVAETERAMAFDHGVVKGHAQVIQGDLLNRADQSHPTTDTALGLHEFLSRQCVDDFAKRRP